MPPKHTTEPSEIDLEAGPGEQIQCRIYLESTTISSTWKPESRVHGCSIKVWVKVEMDEEGRIRFRADSDSKISNGFCSCLIWMLDNAEAGEVLAVETRDLQDVNVEVYVKVNLRVNTWHNVLLAMQSKTQALVTERKQGIRGILMSNEILVVVSFYKFADFPDHNRMRRPLKQLCE